MDPFTILAIAQGGLGLLQGLNGWVNMQNAKRPKYEIPQSVIEATRIARDLANQNMPGYNNSLMQNALATSNALRFAQESGNALNVAPALAAVQAKGAREIDIANANFRLQTKQNLQQQLARMAEEEKTAWQMNKFAPYADLMHKSQTEIGAGIKNVFNAGSLFAFNDGFSGNPQSNQQKISWNWGNPNTIYNTNNIDASINSGGGLIG